MEKSIQFESIDFGYSKNFKYHSSFNFSQNSANSSPSRRPISLKKVSDVYLPPKHISQKRLSHLPPSSASKERALPSLKEGDSDVFETLPGGNSLIALKRKGPKSQSKEQPMPPKPPDKRDERISQMQEIIDDLKEKVKHYQLQLSQTNLREGTTKDLKSLEDAHLLTAQQIKSHLLNYLYDIREVKEKFFSYQQNLKELIQDFKENKSLYLIRENIAQYTIQIQKQMNYEQLYVEVKRQLDRSQMECSHLRHKLEQQKQLIFNSQNHTKDLKFKLNKQIQENQNQAKAIMSQNKVNSEKTFKVESLLQSIQTLTREEDIVKNSTFKEEVIFKRTINTLLKENYELKKQLRLKRQHIEGQDSEITRLKTKVNRLMLKIEEDGNLNRVDPKRNKVNGVQLMATLQAKFQADLADPQHRSSQRINIQTPKSTFQKTNSLFDFEILSQKGGAEILDSVRSKYFSTIGTSREDGEMQVIPKQFVESYDLDYRIKYLMSKNEQELNEELEDSSKQKFIEITMSSQPFIHKERVSFLLKSFVSYKSFSERMGSFMRLQMLALKQPSIGRLMRQIKTEMPHIFQCQRVTLWAKDPMLNEMYTYLDFNKEVRISSVEDIIGYVMNNQKEIITVNLQKYIKHYKTTAMVQSTPIEKLFFDEVQRKSAMIIPVKELDTQMPLGVLEIVNSNSTTFDLDTQFLAYLLAEFSGHIIDNLNSELRRRRHDHARNELNAFAIKLFSQKKLSTLNSVACEAIRHMLSIQHVQFCFVQESLVDLNDYELVIFARDPNSSSEKPTYVKRKTDQFFGIMGYAMKSRKACIIWNPRHDDRYNEQIDMRTSSALYCFPILDYSKEGEKQIVGGVQFEHKQLRNLQGAQSIQNASQQAPGENESVLIEEQLRILMNEFSSYICQVVKIIRNQKLLKKFKDFILHAQEEEVKEHLPVIQTLPHLSSQEVRDEILIHDNYEELKDDINGLQQDRPIGSSRVFHKGETIHYKQQEQKRNSKQFNSVQQNKQPVGLALLKQMTKIENMKADGGEVMSPLLKGSNLRNMEYRNTPLKLHHEMAGIIDSDEMIESESLQDTEDGLQKKAPSLEEQRKSKESAIVIQEND